MVMVSHGCSTGCEMRLVLLVMVTWVRLLLRLMWGVMRTRRRDVRLVHLMMVLLLIELLLEVLHRDGARDRAYGSMRRRRRKVLLVMVCSGRR